MEIPTDPSEEDARIAVATILNFLGYDPDREGLAETPRRVIDALKEMTAEPDPDWTTFDADGYDQMIVQSGIPLYSLCEHHLLPIIGEAHVAYIPNGKIVGLSKLARVVEKRARRLQNQERITSQVADDLVENLDPIGVGIVIEARHLCMEMRGVKKHDTFTTTSDLRGAFREKGEARSEFLQLITSQTTPKR